MFYCDDIKIRVYLSANYVALIENTTLTSPTGDGTVILHGHPTHAKVYPFARQRQYLHFSVEGKIVLENGLQNIFFFCLGPAKIVFQLDA